MRPESFKVEDKGLLTQVSCKSKQSICRNQSKTIPRRGEPNWSLTTNLNLNPKFITLTRGGPIHINKILPLVMSKIKERYQEGAK